jgi:hypothetical protein
MILLDLKLNRFLNRIVASKTILSLIITTAFILLIPSPIFAPSHPEYVGFEKPLKQIMFGVAPGDVKCNEELVLIIRQNGMPACLSATTAKILENRGWGVLHLSCCKNMHQDTSLKQNEPISKILAQECSAIARCITGTITSVIDELP